MKFKETGQQSGWDPKTQKFVGVHKMATLEFTAAEVISLFSALGSYLDYGSLL